MRIDASERAALVDLADLDLLEGHPEAALRRLQPALLKEPSFEYVVPLSATLAVAHLQLANLKEARSDAQRALAEARRSGCWVHGVRALEICGMVEARRGDCHVARALYGEGLQRVRSIPFPYGEANLLYACGLLDQREGDRPSAKAKFADAVGILERLGAARDAHRVRLTTTDSDQVVG